MEFAKRQLAKYGWTEGKGLGRNETGIATALKPKLKFDKTGMGHNAAETFTNHWWENAFNAAADNITINKYVDGSVTVDAESGYEINDHKGTSKKSKHLVYNNFIKTSTLTKEGAITDEPRETLEVPLVAIVPVLTDEELFRACGGRTAHKGARHGLGLNGKLARIEQQEKLLLNLAEKVSENVPLSKRKKLKTSSKGANVSSDFGIKESLCDESTNNDPMVDICAENIDENECTKKEKKSKKNKNKKLSNGIEHMTSNSGDLEKLSDVNTEVSENVQKINFDGKSTHSKQSRKSKKSPKKEKVGNEIEENFEEKVKKRKKKHKESKDGMIEKEEETEKLGKKSKKSVLTDPEIAMAEIELPLLDKKEKRKKRKCVADEVLNHISTTCLDVNSEKSEDAAPTKKKSRRKQTTE